MTTAITEDLLTIESTYCGPPSSAHGGVAVGRFAQLAGPGPVEVRLMGPPPLETPLTYRAEGACTWVVSGPDGDLARVTKLNTPLDIARFNRTSDAEVESASASFLENVAAVGGHGFPTCFACGTDRHDADALRQFGSAASDGDLVARFRVEGHGTLPDWLTLAGLDCPSGHTVFELTNEPPTAAVLGSMSCQVNGAASAGVDYQVRGRLTSVDGRKFSSEVAMLDPDGVAVAEASAVWIAVDPAAFGASVNSEDG